MATVCEKRDSLANQLRELSRRHRRVSSDWWIVLREQCLFLSVLLLVVCRSSVCDYLNGVGFGYKQIQM